MPSVVSGFEYDIFISYRQKDNKYDGWVTEFVSNLRKELEATFKDDISIYFDENPHDGILETHNVDKSLKDKLKTLIFIPIISQTYCDPNSFAWQHELLAFLEMLSNDKFGRYVKLANGNISDRILPVRIHDLDPEDLNLYKITTNEILRPVDFIYRLPGVNRQLRARDDEQIKNPNQILYRDQLNKVARAIKDIINGLKNYQSVATIASVENIQLTKPKPEAFEAPVEFKKVSTTQLTRKSKVVLWTLPIVLLAVVAFFVIPKWLNRQEAKNELLPAIQKLVDENFSPPTQAYDLALEAEKHIPNDSALIKLWPLIATTVSLETQPAGVEVFWKDYDTPEAEWRSAGTTPLHDIRFPRNYLRLELRKNGHQTAEYAWPVAIFRNNPNQFDSARTDILKLTLDTLGSLPENMVRVPGRTTPMFIIGLESHGGTEVDEFLIDRHEVTNKQFKAFMDAGGYTNKSLWNFPIIMSDGKKISLESALTLFVDRTGRQGPATWEAGAYPDGQESHPVTGVSWYEAAAYAAYVQKQLPTVFHWSVVTQTSRANSIIPLSNYNGKSSTAVGSLPGYSTFGIYDLAGNAREWCFNESNDYGKRFILGGGWNDPPYSFNDSYAQIALDRSVTNGFRCIKELPGDSTMSLLKNMVTMQFRDYQKEKPVNDETFEIFRRQYAYDKTPLNDRIEITLEKEFWTVEKISFDAAYNNERMEAYIYLPKNFRAPFQPILYFPTGWDVHSKKFNIEAINDRIDFILKSGRALIVPVYKGTHERQDGLKSDLPEETIVYRDHVIMWRKDVGRTLDYLETRMDIQSDKVGFLGWSWGGIMGAVIPALETRIKAVVLTVGGMEMRKALPEADQINFLPRISQPVLMLNGKHDMYYPVETSQKPMFDFLGTPKKDKKILIYESGHLVPRTEFVKETLRWFDQYLGPVK